MREGIPYTMVGGLKFYDRKEIKDILAYLRLVFNPLDTVSLLRIINVPKRGIGTTTIGKLTAYAASHGVTIFEVISDPDLLGEVPGLTARSMKPLERFSALIFELMGHQAQMGLEEFVERVLKESGYMADLESEKSKAEIQSRIDNLQEFVGVAKDFEASEESPTLENFLAQVSLVSDIDSAEMEEDRVTLMTLHSAKGLEFPVVFMAGMEEGIFPHARTFMEREQLEEERRTCYVGITRAQRKLYMTYARMRTIFGRTNANDASRFMGEIPYECFAPAEDKASSARYEQRGGGVRFRGTPPSALEAMGGISQSRKEPKPVSAQVIRPDPTIRWSVGDKAKHGKFGVGTVVSVKGSGEETELRIAFPNQGVKAFTLKYAPIAKA